MLEYACGLTLGLVLISTENPNFETAFKIHSAGNKGTIQLYLGWVKGDPNYLEK
jgi:hypothetical protein